MAKMWKKKSCLRQFHSTGEGGKFDSLLSFLDNLRGSGAWDVMLESLRAIGSFPCLLPLHRRAKVIIQYQITDCLIWDQSECLPLECRTWKTSSELLLMGRWWKCQISKPPRWGKKLLPIYAQSRSIWLKIPGRGTVRQWVTQQMS